MGRRALWMPLLLALPVGAAGGVLLAVAVYGAGNADYRAQGGWGAFGSLVGAGAMLGAMTALAAAVGAVVAVLAVARGRRSARGPVLLGAAGGAAAVWLGIGVVNAVVVPGGASWLPLAMMIACVASLVALALAALLLRLASTRERAPAAAHADEICRR